MVRWSAPEPHLNPYQLCKMLFDPTYPHEYDALDAAPMRAQLNALHDEITSIPQGPPGPEGPQGLPGEQGPPFASALVDSVITLPPGENATVTVTFDWTNVHFTFAIPRGADGAPGEVTIAQLDSAIAATARNPTGVSPLTQSISDPPTQAEVQAIQDAYNALLGAVVRV